MNADDSIFLKWRLMASALKMGSILLAAGAVAWLFSPVPGRAQTASSPALDVLRQRFVRLVLPVAAPDVREVNRLAARYERTLGADGHWPDLNYQNQDRASWVGGDHLTRVLLMAKAVRLAREAGLPDGKLTARTLTALKAWTATDPQNPNWWWNRIGVPELVAEIAVLLGDELPADELARDLKILRRSDMKGMTGANLTWCAINQVILGCLEKTPAVTRAAYDRLYGEIRFADATSHFEGLQADFSFHQHGPQLYNGGYGLFYADDVGRFIYVAWGTPFQIPTDRKTLFDHFMLDGMRWMTRGSTIDYSTMGRNLTRPGGAAASPDWSRGPVSPAGAAYSLKQVVRWLATLPGPRQGEYRDWAECLAGRDDRHEPVGNKHFWCSDYMVHRRKAFLTSVKMFSTRTQNAEMVNGEGRRSQHLSDGANFLYLTGREYLDIFPCWDWQKIPGTTAEQLPDPNAMDPRAIGVRGQTTFVGGVSDGLYGLCAMDLRRDALRAKKAWFFFDRAYVCLGAGISDDSGRPVVTDVNQTLLGGEVFDNESRRPLAIGNHPLPNVTWVHHHRVGYFFADGQNVFLSMGDRSGRWSDIGRGPAAPVTRPVFDLWIVHGAGCTNANYNYTILPDATVEQTRAWARHPGLNVLYNTAESQGVYCPEKKLAELVFWEAGSIETPFGRVRVDQPGLFMLRETADSRFQITAANPRNEPLVVNICLGNRETRVVLPGGAAGGSSVETWLP